MMRLSLKCELLVSKFAFKFNLYRYVTAEMKNLRAAVGGEDLPVEEGEEGEEEEEEESDDEDEE